MAILADLNDPRIQHVTVTAVEMTPDMRQAKVHVSIMGDETKQRLSLAGLKSAAGYLQSKVANRIDTRYTPKLEFILDQGVKRSIQIAEILGRVLPRDPNTEQETDAEEEVDAEQEVDVEEESDAEQEAGAEQEADQFDERDDDDLPEDRSDSRDSLNDAPSDDEHE